MVVVGSIINKLISVAPSVTPREMACGFRMPAPKASEAAWNKVEAATTEK